MRDMVQNHMFQLMALVAMEPPAALDAVSIRDEKVKVYQVGPPDPPEPGRRLHRPRAVRRRRSDGQKTEGYLKEKDVAAGLEDGDVRRR